MIQSTTRCALKFGGPDKDGGQVFSGRAIRSKPHDFFCERSSLDTLPVSASDGAVRPV
jgi:hypothetical protein